jgi:hypothetical protein
LQTVTEGKERRSTWVKSQVGRAQGNVRFTPESGHSAAGQISNIEKLFDRLVDAIE